MLPLDLLFFGDEENKMARVISIVQSKEFGLIWLIRDEN